MKRRPAPGAPAVSRLALLLAALVPAWAHGTAAGTTIHNVATISFIAVDGTTASVQSNQVAAVVLPPASTSSISILRVTSPGEGAALAAGPTQCADGSGVRTLPPPLLAGGGSVDFTEPVALVPTGALHAGDAVFIQVTDPDQNRDAATVDTATVRLATPGGDAETLHLRETGPDTGIFVGYIQTAAAAASAGSCVLEVERNAQISALYVDPVDSRDTSRAGALVDPHGVVFDSRTGQPVDGARIRLLNAVTGTPATVLGDDGTSSYPAEVVTGATVTDAAGTLYDLPAGAFRFPIVAAGGYRIEVDPPAGHTFPSRSSIAELAMTPGGHSRLSAGSFGGTIDAAAPGDVALDIPVDAAATQLYIRKSTTTTVAAIGDFVQYTLQIENPSSGAALSAVRTVDVLPPGMRYRPGSARARGQRSADPQISADGRTLTFVSTALPAGQQLEIRYVVEVTAGAHGKQLINTAQAHGPGGLASNAAQATIQLREELFRERAIVIGRVVEGGCSEAAHELRGVAGVRVYMEDGRYSVTDEEGKYHFEDLTPGSHVVQLDRVTIAPTHEVAACHGGPRQAGRGDSQFVDLRAGALWRSDFVLKRRLQPVGPQIGNGAAGTARDDANADKAPQIEQQLTDVERRTPGVEWVLPASGAAPAVPSIKVAVAHLPAQRVELLVNGAAVSPLNFDGVATNQAKTLSISRWRAVDLRDGENELIAIIAAADGTEVQRLARWVNYAGGAARAELVRKASTLVADGRTRPVIALRMVDAAGQPARPGTVGAYQVEAPYRSWWDVESLNANKLVAVGTREPTFVVDADGIARLELEPTSRAGTAIVRLRFNQRQQQEIRVWLEPQARDWVLVGLAENTAAYKTISDNMQSASQAGLQEGYQDEGRVAFFAKGAIKGEYLLTAAYDSAREHGVDEQGLLGTVEPDRFYTLYGDATEQRFEAATSRKLFIKLERRQFAALFGDFETGLTVTELSRYSRTFTGFKADYAGEHFGYTAFASRTQQGYVRDELPGEGTSGLYRLSRRPLILNSEKVRLETRDRFRSEAIIESRPLTRSIDYSIDYLSGTLFFKQPVPSRDAAFNPVFIVAEYEVLNDGAQQLIAGGRAAVKLAADRLELGASYLNEGAASGDSRIAGTDLRWQIHPTTQLRAELARSQSDDPLRTERADAYLTRIEHVSGNLEAIAYVREQQGGFGVGQQGLSQAATRKTGFDGRYRFAEHLLLEAEAYGQRVLDTGAERQLASAGLRHEADDYTWGAGARHVADRHPLSGDTRSQQAFVNGSVDLFADRVTVRAAQDFELAGAGSSSIDFPARSLLGVDYHWRADTTFFAEYEQARGTRLDADMTRIGVRTMPWQRAQLQSSVSQQAGEYGPRVFANVGLTQGWQLDERWSLDLGVDQSRTVSGAAAVPLDTRTPLASGSLQNDFFATYVGALYRSGLWTFTARLENRDSDAEDRRIVSGGFYREPLRGHAFSLATRWIDSSGGTVDLTAGEAQLGWAFRPPTSAWIILDRLDLKHDTRRDMLGRLQSARAINNLNASWQLDQSTQLGLQLGARYTRSRFDGDRYDGLSSLYGLDMRRDLSARFDIGLHGTLLRSLASAVRDYSIGLDLGVAPAHNVWISIGYNFTGFSDDDFAASRYSAQGPFIKFRMKADQDTFKDLSLQALRAPR